MKHADTQKRAKHSGESKRKRTTRTQSLRRSDIVCIVNGHYKETNMPDDHRGVGGESDVQEKEKSRAVSNGKLILFATQHKLQRSQHA